MRAQICARNCRESSTRWIPAKSEDSRQFKVGIFEKKKKKKKNSMLSEATGSGKRVGIEFGHTRQVLALLNVEQDGRGKRRSIAKCIGKIRRANLRVNRDKDRTIHLLLAVI
jgi:hypothetical protein